MKDINIDNEDIDLEYTNNIRKKILNSIKDHDIESFSSMKLTNVSQLLADMDKVSLAKKKIKSDEGITNVAKQASMLITEMYTKVNHNLIKDNNKTGTIKELNNIKNVDLIEGELSTDIATMDYTSFINKS